MRYRFHTVGTLLLVSLIGSGCAYSTTARNWNGLSGEDCKPKYYTMTTKVGFNLLVAVPFLGDMDVAGLTRDVTAQIKQHGGDDVRIVQGSTESYFYGWPPFTWLLTPVVSKVSAEYVPNPEKWEQEQNQLEAKNYQTGHWWAPWTW